MKIAFSHLQIYEISGLTDTPLSKLHTQDPQYSVVKNRLECARSTIERMMRAVDDALATCEGCEEIVVWKRCVFIERFSFIFYISYFSTILTTALLKVGS